MEFGSRNSIWDDTINIFNQRLSWKEKKANDFEWAKKCADYIDDMYSPLKDKDRVDRILMNYNLFNGIGNEAMMEYCSTPEAMNVLQEEGYSGGYENIQHYPVIDQIAKALVGEQQLRPLTPIAVDSSEQAMNSRKRKRLGLMQNLLYKKVVEPIMIEVTQKIMQELGVEDPSQLPPEQAQQVQSQIQSEIEAATPEEIENYMRKDYKSPSETQAQAVINFLMDKLDIKYMTDEAFKHLIISGEEIYRVGIRHNMPFLEIVDPLGFTDISRPNGLFVEDGIAAKYEQYVLYNDIYNWHGDEIGNSTDIKKKLDSYIGYTKSPVEILTTRMLNENPSALESLPGYKSLDHQDALKQIFGRHKLSKKGGDIRYVHITWKTLRKLRYITRVEEGKEIKFWIDENYKFNPLHGDIKEEEAWVPEVWEATKVGDGNDTIYLDIGPVKGQYKSLTNPWDVKLPYIGAKYSKLMGNTNNISPMDPGKPWQYKFNIQMARIHETESSDLGKIFLTSFHAKPKDWSWQKFMMMAKYGKILPIDLTQEGVTPADAQIFKSLDLSTDDKKAGQIQYLEFLRNQVAIAMSYNPSRLGSQSASLAVSNNQQNIQQSSYQTYDIYNLHNKVVENLLNAILNTARIAFRDNENMKTYILSDMSIAELEIDNELLERSELGIKLKNSAQDLENILEVKRLMQPMVQNGLISFPELIRMQFSKSASELMNIAENAEAKMIKRQAEQQQAQQQQMEQQAQIAQQLEQMRQQFQMGMQQMKLESEERQSEIESTRFAQQQDIDQNNVADVNEREALRLEFELYKFDKEYELKELELKLKYNDNSGKLKVELSKLSQDKELEMKKLKDNLEIKNKEIAVKRTQKKSK